MTEKTVTGLWRARQEMSGDLSVSRRCMCYDVKLHVPLGRALYISLMYKLMAALTIVFWGFVWRPLLHVRTTTSGQPDCNEFALYRPGYIIPPLVWHIVCPVIFLAYQVVFGSKMRGPAWFFRVFFFDSFLSHVQFVMASIAACHYFSMDLVCAQYQHDGNDSIKVVWSSGYILFAACLLDVPLLEWLVFPPLTEEGRGEGRILGMV